ncbi:type II secretion system protein [Caldifermentibacillus hisashii]|uniref:type II secretion system protein n=1 Tax=Caldifermentibacillus hisashii TaxID=996558 RepID=UPI0034D5878B
MMRQHLKQMKNEKGMTLVELLAVLVIIGIIAAITIPLIGNVIENSRNKATVSEAVNIIEAAKLANANTTKTTEYTKSNLGDYLDNNIKGTNYTVTLENGVWYIKDHPACAIVSEGKKEEDKISESQLTEYLDK